MMNRLKGKHDFRTAFLKRKLFKQVKTGQHVSGVTKCAIINSDNTIQEPAAGLINPSLDTQEHPYVPDAVEATCENLGLIGDTAQSDLVLCSIGSSVSENSSLEKDETVLETKPAGVADSEKAAHVKAVENVRRSHLNFAWPSDGEEQGEKLLKTIDKDWSSPKERRHKFGKALTKLKILTRWHKSRYSDASKRRKRLSQGEQEFESEENTVIKDIHLDPFVGVDSDTEFSCDAVTDYCDTQARGVQFSASLPPGYVLDKYALTESSSFCVNIPDRRHSVAESVEHPSGIPCRSLTNIDTCPETDVWVTKSSNYDAQNPSFTWLCARHSNSSSCNLYADSQDSVFSEWNSAAPGSQNKLTSRQDSDVFLPSPIDQPFQDLGEVLAKLDNNVDDQSDFDQTEKTCLKVSVTTDTSDHDRYPHCKRKK